MVKITSAALSKIQEEVKPLIDEGKQPCVRFAMGIG